MFKFKKIALIASVFTATALSLAAFAACGADGKDGVDGKDGKDGKDGVNGVNGVDGKDGVSVTDATIDENGNLILTLSDETTIEAGKVWKEDETPETAGHTHTLAATPLTYVKNMYTGPAGADHVDYKVGDRVTALYKCTSCGEVLAQESHIDNWNANVGTTFNREGVAAGWAFTLPSTITDGNAKDGHYLKAGVVAADRTCYITEETTPITYTKAETETLTLIGYNDIYNADKTMKADWKKFTIGDNTYYTNNRSTVEAPASVLEALAGKGWVLEVVESATCNVKAVFSVTYYDYALNADKTDYTELGATAISYWVDGINLEHFYDITQGKIVFAKEITDADGYLYAYPNTSTTATTDNGTLRKNWNASLALRAADLDAAVVANPNLTVSAEGVKDANHIDNFTAAYYMVECANCTEGDDVFVQVYAADVKREEAVLDCDTSAKVTVTATYAFQAGGKDIVSTRVLSVNGTEAPGHVYQIYDQNGKPQYVKYTEADKTAGTIPEGKKVGDYNITATAPVNAADYYSYWALDESGVAIEKTCLVCGATTTIALPTAADVDNEEDEWTVTSNTTTCTADGKITFTHTMAQDDLVKPTTLEVDEVRNYYNYIVDGTKTGHTFDVLTTENLALNYADYKEGTTNKAVNVVCTGDDFTDGVNVPVNGKTGSNLANTSYDTVIITKAELTASTAATCKAPATKTITYTIVKRAIDKDNDGVLKYNSNGAPIWKTVTTWTISKTYETAAKLSHGSDVALSVVAYPTNTTPGLAQYTCKKCGEVVAQIVLPAINPSEANANYGDKPETAPTCTEDGIVYYVANRAYVVYVDETIDANVPFITNELNMLWNTENPYDGNQENDYNVTENFEVTAPGKPALGHEMGAWRQATGSDYKWVRECQRTYANGQHYDGYIEVSNLDNPEA